MKPRKIIWSPTTRRRQLGPQVEEKVVCQEAQKRCRHHPSTSKTICGEAKVPRSSEGKKSTT